MLVDLLRSSFDKNKKEVHEEYARLAQFPIQFDWFGFQISWLYTTVIV